MSFTVGVYDLFAYTIPGIIYLFVGNEILRLFGFVHLDYNSVSTPASFALIIMVAFILGHIMDYPAHGLIILSHRNAPTRAIEYLKKSFPFLNIRFQPQERAVLYAFLRLNHPEISQKIDNNKALSILFQNISLGLILYSFFVVLTIVVNGFSVGNLILLLVTAVFSFDARQRSLMFNSWFNNSIFEAALSYGTSTEEILKGSHILYKTRNKAKSNDERIER